MACRPLETFLLNCIDVSPIANIGRLPHIGPIGVCVLGARRDIPDYLEAPDGGRQYAVAVGSQAVDLSEELQHRHTHLKDWPPEQLASTWTAPERDVVDGVRVAEQRLQVLGEKCDQHDECQYGEVPAVAAIKNIYRNEHLDDQDGATMGPQTAQCQEEE